MPFEFDGERYKEASAHQKEWGARLIAELNLKGDERILDLGCGDGALTARLARLVPCGFVVGIDASEGMIESARKHEETNLEFQLADIDNLKYEDEFDVVFSNATLHWIKDHRRLLARVRKSLCCGGVLRFDFGGKGNCSHFYKVVREVMAREEYARYFADFQWPWYMPDVEEYKDLVENAGFVETHVWGENADRYFPDADALTGWIDQPSLVPFLKCIDGPDKQRFRDTVVERMIEETRQDDGTCFETFRRVNAFARK